jgi:hypothetical protein
MMAMTVATKLNSKKSLSFSAVGLWCLFLFSSLLLIAATQQGAPPEPPQKVAAGITGEIVSCSG